MGKTTTLILPDGALYIGEVNSAGIPESDSATCAWPDGSSYTGMWVNGQISGVGKLYKGGQVIKYGYWWKGELLHEFPLTADNPNTMPFIQPIGHQESQGTNHKSKIAALVIGNDKYQEKPLNNCVNDARAIAHELRSIGVDVNVLSDASKQQMLDAVMDLGVKATQYKNAFFFFSGHGLSNHGRHYIMSTDNSPLCIEEIDEYLSGVDYENIIIASDACSVIVSGDGNTEMVRSAGRTLMAFSSSLGAMAYDGIPHEHSPFAFGLLQYISKPMSIVQVFLETNKFAMSYAIDHAFYQQPVLVISPYFPMDYKLIEV